jgi:hypothetical protein
MASEASTSETATGGILQITLIRGSRILSLEFRFAPVRERVREVCRFETLREHFHPFILD